MKKIFIPSPLLVPVPGPVSGSFSGKEKQLNFAHTFVFFCTHIQIISVPTTKKSILSWKGGLIILAQKGARSHSHIFGFW